jgi:hypothetical protein
MIKPFSDNRLFIRQVLERENIFQPVESSDYTIEEKKARGSNLKYLHLENLPYSVSSSAPNIWVFDFEHENNPIFYTPKCRKMEKALIIFSTECAYVIMIEMKTSLMGLGDDGIGENGIEAKIKDSLSKLSLMATPYIFGEEHNYIKKIKFYSIIVYNNEHITQEANEDRRVKDYFLYDVFIASQSGNTKTKPVRDLFGQNFDVKIYFIKNDSNNTQEFTIDINSLIDENIFSNAVYHDFVCP